MKQHNKRDENEIIEEIEKANEQELEALEREQEDKEQSEKKQKPKKKTKEQQLSEDLDEAKDKLLRVMAEYDNYRKRTDREKQSAVSLGTALAVEKILPVLDTLEMAASAETADAEYKKGVEMTVTMFKTALESLGVVEIEADGKPFDPNIHNCVASEESDACESGTIIRVLQKGYKLNDRVIRPSMVAVAA